MKSKILKIIKSVTLPVIALAIIISGTFSTAVDVSAAEITTTYNGTKGEKYVQYSGLTYSDYWGTKAPEYAVVDENGVGYFFSGWYAKEGDAYTPIKSEAELTSATTVVAKFVPAQTMSVKCQNQAGVNADSDGVIMRVLAGIDSTDYKTAGFKVSIVEDGVAKPEKTCEIEKVYNTFKWYASMDDTNPTSYKASDVFGTTATYFTTCTVGTIPKGQHDTIICIKPYWVTLDGVTVYGLSKYAHVEDGYRGYVNVPVNLNILSESNGAAAGMLSVKAPEGLNFIGVEKGVELGKVFDEMEFNVLSDGTIKCVGNTSDVSEKKEMDVYINLKFQKTEAAEALEKGEFYTITVNGEDFVNSNEKDLTTQDVWNVIY